MVKSATATERPEPSFAERVLTLAGLLYLTTIPLDATSLLGGISVTAAVGMLVLVAWLFSLLASERIPTPTRETRLLTFVVVSFSIWILIRFPASYDVGFFPGRTATYLALALTIPALARAFRYGTQAPIVAFTIGSTATSLVLLTKLVGNATTDQDFRSTGLGLNENQAACLLAVGVVFAVILAARYTGMRRILLLVAALTCAAGVLSAGSKTGLIAIVASALVIPIILARSSEWSRNRVIIGSAFVVFSAGVLWSARGLFPQRLAETLISVETGDLTTRQGIWSALWYYRDTWLPWGVGLDKTFDLTTSLYGAGKVAHNTFIEAGVELGIIGFILVVAFFIAVIVTGRLSPYRSYVWCGLVPILVFSISTSLFYFKVVWVLAAFAVVSPVSTRVLGTAGYQEAGTGGPRTPRQARMAPRAAQAARVVAVESSSGTTASSPEGH